MAYHDLLIQEVLDNAKRQKKTSAKAITDYFFSDFTEINASLMSADPVSFPGFRNSIESALKKGVTPCGVVTGLGTIKIGDREQRVGALDRKSTRLNSSHVRISYAVFCLKK